MKKILIILAVFITNLFAPSYAIKIGLQTAVKEIGVGASTSAVIIDANTNRSVCALEAMKGYEVRPYRNKIAIKYNGKYYKIDSDNVVLKTEQQGFVSVKNKWYRGNLMIQNKDGRLTVINDVNIEDYIKGVLPSEMPSGWEPEALKAQAVAARSFALANLGKRAKFGYDLNDTTEIAKQLAEYLHDIKCNINLIPYNPTADNDYKRPSNNSIMKFKCLLEHSGKKVTVRLERGADIDAACGQLKGKVENGV